MSFEMEVNKDTGSSASAMAGIDSILPLPASIFEPFQEKEVHRSPARWESGHFHKGRDQLSMRSRKKEMDYKGLDLWK